MRWCESILKFHFRRVWNWNLISHNHIGVKYTPSRRQWCKRHLPSHTLGRGANIEWWWRCMWCLSSHFSSDLYSPSAMNVGDTSHTGVKYTSHTGVKYTPSHGYWCKRHLSPPPHTHTQPHTLSVSWGEGIKLSDGEGACEVWDLASQVMCAPHVHWIHVRQLYQAAESTAVRTPLKNLRHLFSIKPQAPLLVTPLWRIYNICFQGDLPHTEIKYNNQPKRIFWMNYQFF